jgi:photosystem II stability/assembly factor-like uncharacterized protein
MRSPHRALAASLAAAAVLCGAAVGHVRTAPASGIDADLFASLAWRPIGPHRPGDVTAIAAPARSATTWIAGTREGGLWRTVDAGRTWSVMLDVPSIAAVAVAPGDAHVIYAGTGDASPDAPAGDGLYASTDAGRTWTRTGLARCRVVGAIAVDPDDATRLFVAARGDAYIPGDDRGIFRSLDGGRTFTRVLAAGPATDGMEVALDPGHPEIVYATLRERHARAGSRAFTGGPDTGVYTSADGGTTWRPIGAGLPTFEADGMTRITIAVGPGTAGRVFAGVTARTRGGLYRSDDGGQSWTHVHDALADPAADLSITVDPRNADVVYAVSSRRIWRSTDAGRSFEPAWADAASIAPERVWLAPADADVMIAAGDRGARATINGGETWSDAAPPASSLSAITADEAFPYRVCGVTTDAETWCVSSRSTAASVLPFPAGASVAPDPLDPTVVYGGGVTRYDRASAQAQDVGPTGAPGRGVLRFADMDAHTLLFATDRLWTTNTGGLTWSTASVRLTRGDAPAAGADAAPRVVTALTTSTVDRRTIWTGTSDGAVRVTRDAGASWTDVTPSTIPEWASIASIEASHFDPASAYAAVDMGRLGDDGAHILRTRDGGMTWTDIAGGLPAHASVHAVREDARRRGLLFAATDRSVFVSFDDGESWQPLRLNLPAMPVRDLLIKDADLVAATAGRGVWILDDISPLRQMTADLSHANAFLFRPSTAWRIQPTADGSAVADDGAPPDGVALDYLIGANVTGPLTIEIREAVTGEVLRRYSSDATGATGGAPLVATPGLHRVVWDLRYAPPGRPPAGRLGDEPRGARHGVWVKPGTYQVRLTAGAHVIRQAVVVKMDPRVRTSTADLDAQFDVADRLSRTMDVLAAHATGQAADTAAPRDVVAAWNTLADLFDRVLAADARPTAAVSEAAEAAITRADTLAPRVARDRIVN